MRILYATDGSQDALAGARLLASLPLQAAGGAAAAVRVLTVIDEDAPESAGEPALRAATEALASVGVPVAAETRRGNAAEQIVDAAGDEKADLVVVGTRGQGALERFFIGSVASRVARHAPCPVLMARPLRGGTLDEVLLAVDGSPGAQRAADYLQGFPLPPVALRLVTVVTPVETLTSRMMASPVAEQLRALLREERGDAQARLDALAPSFTGKAAHGVTTEVRSDDAAEGLLRAADEASADLLVLGARGMSAIDRFLLGSVSERVLRYAEGSVLVVRG